MHSMKRQLLALVVRWLLNSFGIWIAVRLFGTGIDNSVLEANIPVFLLAGLIFSVVNAVLRPIITILSLPAILLTLGLFTVIVNGILVYISLMLAPGISMAFWNSVLAGLVLSLVNYIVSSMLEIEYTNASQPQEKP